MRMSVIARARMFCYHSHMPHEVIDLRKKKLSLSNEARTTSSVSLAVPSDARLLETYIPALPAEPINVQESKVYAPAALPAPVVGSDEESLDDTHAPPSEADRGFDLEWSSYEHEYRIRGPYWFLYPLAGATIGIAFGITTQSYLFVSFVFIAFVMLTYHAKQPPRMLNFAIEKRGVWVGDRLLDYSKVKSFWIFTHALMAPELLLETASPINPLIHIRLEGVDVDEVKQVISRYLPEKEQKDRASHQIARIIGF